MGAPWSACLAQIACRGDALHAGWHFVRVYMGLCCVHGRRRFFMSNSVGINRGGFSPPSDARVSPRAPGANTLKGLRAAKVGTGKCGRDGHGTVRERETIWFFVLDREFPNRPVLGLRSRRLPSRRAMSCCSRPIVCPVPECCSSHCLPTCSYTIPTLANSFSRSI